MTLKGIVHGFDADLFAVVLDEEGCTEILIDTGERRPLGGDPRGGDWSVRVEGGPLVPLRNRALATSAPLGSLLDARGRI